MMFLGAVFKASKGKKNCWMKWKLLLRKRFHLS